jgi:hypothetical protein
VDGEAVAATNGSKTVLVTGFESGVARAWLSEDGGRFAPAQIEGTDDRFLSVYDVVAFDGGFLAIGNGYPSFRPRLWRSTGGAVWELVDTGGLGDPADIHRLVTTSDGLIAIGARRTGAEPAEGPFAPSVWMSSDGESWTDRTSPVIGDGSIVDVVAIDGGLVAITQLNGTIKAWRSTDAAATWSERPIEGSVRGLWLTSLATDGRVLLGVGAVAENMVEGDPAVLRSDDGGRSFTASPLAGPVQGALGEGGAATTFADGAWWAATNRYIDSFRDPDACYRDVESCEHGAKAVLLQSTDGVTWSELDTSSMTGRYGDFSTVVDTPTGPLVIGREEQLTTWRWLSPQPPPALPPFEEPTPLQTPLARWGDTIEPGVTYRYPLYIHCGMEVLGEFNGKYWYRARGKPAPETGAGEEPPPHWPVAQQSIFGYITLADDDTIEYTIDDDEVIATYRPSNKEPPGCA